MDRTDVAAWVERYRRTWESNDPDDIESLFADDGRYLTEPYAEPWAGREAIVRGWLEHRDEPGQTEFTFEVIAVDGDLGIVRGQTKYLDPPERVYSNLWLVRLDGDGRCREFVEW